MNFDSAHLKRIIEAALLAAAQPLSLPQLQALFVDNEPVTHEDVARAVEELRSDCAERGIELIEVASGFRYQVRQDVHAWVARLWTERATKYSRALLETLALIAYRQPITRAEIEQIRGVAVSSSIVKTLEEREWVRVVGYRDVPGKPALFGTTRGFLDYFNLKSLDELPPLAEIRDIDEFEPELNLGPIAPGSAPAAADDGDGEAATEEASAADSDAAETPAAETPAAESPAAESAPEHTEAQIHARALANLDGSDDWEDPDPTAVDPAAGDAAEFPEEPVIDAIADTDDHTADPVVTDATAPTGAEDDTVDEAEFSTRVADAHSPAPAESDPVATDVDAPATPASEDATEHNA